MSINAKLKEIQTKVQTVEKQGENKFSHYSYVMLGTILNRVNSLFDEAGILVVQSEVSSTASLEFTDNGYYSVGHVRLQTTATDVETGESITVESSGFAADKNGDKALFKATTGARKYGLTMLLKLHWDSVEPEEDTPAIGAKSKSTKKPQASNSDAFF